VRPILFNRLLLIRATIQASSARSNVASVHKAGAYKLFCFAAGDKLKQWRNRLENVM